MPVTSLYVQISDYALIEYIYSDETITTTQARCLRLQNKYTNTYQFINNAQAYQRTGNILDRSASKMGTESQAWAYHDIDVSMPIIEINNNFVLTDVTSNLLPSQHYDTIRLHLLSGYTLPGLDGLILEVLFNEWTATGTNCRPFTAGAQVYLKSEPTITFDPNPIFIADRYFDRYVEFKIPSLFAVNLDYWSSPAATNTLGYQYTFNGVGFLNNSQISLNLYEINSTDSRNGNRYLRTGTIYNASVNQQDENSFIGAVIQENSENDYIEYYPTYQGGYLEDYINLLNETGSWVVINQLTVSEQVGTNFVKTSDVTILQEENFDQPSFYRPVIRNAPAVYAYSIEYIMRLLNKVTNKEIVRRSTFTSTDVKKYGLQLEKINALEGFRPIKVYNKIIKSEEAAVAGIAFGSPRFITQIKFVNNYYDVNLISVDSTTDVTATIGQKVWPQGQNVFLMNSFDNYVKFKIFTKSADKKQDVTMDLASTGMNIKLSFVYDDKSQVYIDPTQNIAAANPGAGEVLFRIDSTIAVKLLNGITRSYYIVNRTTDGDDVLIYSGQFADTNVNAVTTTTTIVNDNLDLIAQLHQKIADLTAALDAKAVAPVEIIHEAKSPEKSPASEVLVQADKTTQDKTRKQIGAVTKQVAAIQRNIQEAGQSGKQIAIGKMNIPEIPGLTPPVTTINWSALPPIVENPSGQNIPAGNITPKDGRNTGTTPGTTNEITVGQTSQSQTIVKNTTE